MRAILLVLPLIAAATLSACSPKTEGHAGAAVDQAGAATASAAQDTVNNVNTAADTTAAAAAKAGRKADAAADAAAKTK